VCIDPESIPLTSRTESGKPTLPLLLHLPVAPDRHINIAEEVGEKNKFGGARGYKGGANAPLRPPLNATLHTVSILYMYAVSNMHLPQICS